MHIHVGTKVATVSPARGLSFYGGFRTQLSLLSLLEACLCVTDRANVCGRGDHWRATV